MVNSQKTFLSEIMCGDLGLIYFNKWDLRLFKSDLVPRIYLTPKHDKDNAKMISEVVGNLRKKMGLSFKIYRRCRALRVSKPLTDFRLRRKFVESVLRLRYHFGNPAIRKLY